MNISKLLKRVLLSFMFHVTDGDGGGPSLEAMFEDRDGGGNEDGNGDGADDESVNGDELVLTGDDGAGGEDEEGNGDGQEPVFEIPVGDGKTITKTQSELIAEASKYHGANRKFEEAAAIRKDAEQKLAQVPEREKQLGTVLEHYIRESQALLASQQPNWEALLAQDPNQYVRVRHQWEQRQAQLHEAMQVKQAIDQRNAEQQAASLQGRLSEAAQKIVEAIPAWKDPAKAAEGAQAVGKYLESQGIPAAMQAQMDTAEVFLIARKAMLYDQAMAKQKAVQQGVRTAPRTERPGASQVTPKNQLAKANAGKAFKANPTVNTLAAFFE